MWDKKGKENRHTKLRNRRTARGRKRRRRVYDKRLKENRHKKNKIKK